MRQEPRYDTQLSPSGSPSLQKELVLISFILTSIYKVNIIISGTYPLSITEGAEATVKDGIAAVLFLCLLPAVIEHSRRST